MFAMPPMSSATEGFTSAEKPKPLATSVTFGTLREAVTLLKWMHPHRREVSLMCLKTTIVPMSAHTSNETGSFASPAILFHLSPPTADEPSVPTLPGAVFPVTSTSAIKANLADKLPRMAYRGRGSLDLRGVFDLYNGMLVERTTGLRRRRTIPTTAKPHIWIDFHHLSRYWNDTQTYSRGSSVPPLVSSDPDKAVPRRRINPFPGALVLDTKIPLALGPGGEEELKQGLNMCYSSGRAVIVRPRARSVEIFDFK